jgi:hypothetical protein
MSYPSVRRADGRKTLTFASNQCLNPGRYYALNLNVTILKGDKMRYYWKWTMLLMTMGLCGCGTNQGKAFYPGQIWKDNNGVHINAHGGGILYHEGIYYWFGEHKIAGTAGKAAHVGVQCYSSKDLYNWTDKGIALAVVHDDPEHPLTPDVSSNAPR